MSKLNNDFFELNEIIDNTIEGILIIQEGFIKNVNKPFIEMLKYDNADDLIGNLATGILIPNSKEKYIKYNSKIFQEISLLTKDGNSIPAIIKIKDIVLNEKELKMVSILDLSEIKEQELFMVEQSRFAAMGELMSMIAHQWRQPLTSLSSIIVRLNLKLKTRSIDIDLFDEKLHFMNDQIQYMSKTIDDFRDFMLVNKQKEKAYLSDIILSSVTMIKDSFLLNDIEVDIKESKLEEIMTLKNEILQVVLNILNNSKDAFISNNIKNRKIKIYLEEKNDVQIIFIEDNAGGIPNKIIDNIFDPYFSTKDKKNGTGLGLYISKIIIEKHLNGKLSIRNKENGILVKIKLIK